MPIVPVLLAGERLIHIRTKTEKWRKIKFLTGERRKKNIFKCLQMALINWTVTKERFIGTCTHVTGRTNIRRIPWHPFLSHFNPSIPHYWCKVPFSMSYPWITSCDDHFGMKTSICPLKSGMTDLSSLITHCIKIPAFIKFVTSNWLTEAKEK